MFLGKTTRRGRFGSQAARCAALIALAGATLSAQAPATPPPDLADPPAEAVESESGLVSRVLEPGSSPVQPTTGDIVTLHYTGWAASDGRMIDSSASRARAPMFPLEGTMAGLRECVRLMRVGEKRRCWIPQELAYKGREGRPSGPVVFDLELLDVHRSPALPPPTVSAPPEDAMKTESGLAYEVLRPGTGTRSPTALSQVTVHYTGWTTDGKMFDSSLVRGEPATFGLSDVIPGWTEGVQLMVEGERRRFWIPQELAYKGEAGQPAGMLVFDIELIAVQ
jgi:FKBP-type peptidyl-prolyl cis-trans isomerase